MNVHVLPLDEARCRALVTAAVLHKSLPHVLAPFEEELLWELSERGLTKDAGATVTADEWAIVEDSLESLRKACGRRKAEANERLGCFNYLRAGSA